jgi:hypothetical protein
MFCGVIRIWLDCPAITYEHVDSCAWWWIKGVWKASLWPPWSKKGTSSAGAAAPCAFLGGGFGLWHCDIDMLGFPRFYVSFASTHHQAPNMWPLLFSPSPEFPLQSTSSLLLAKILAKDSKHLPLKPTFPECLDDLWECKSGNLT